MARASNKIEISHGQAATTIVWRRSGISQNGTALLRTEVPRNAEGHPDWPAIEAEVARMQALKGSSIGRASRNTRGGTS